MFSSHSRVGTITDVTSSVIFTSLSGIFSAQPGIIEARAAGQSAPFGLFIEVPGEKPW
jgi:hypothetical protein